MALTTVPVSLSATALTLTTAAQPNITSVGTLTGLTVSGNIAGTLTTAAQTNITSVGTLSSLTVSGALNGTLSTAAQTNITSVGTLSSLTVSGALNGTLSTAAQTNITSVGTLTGLTSSGSIQTTGASTYFISNSSSSGDYIRIYAGSGTGKWDIYGNGANLRFSDNDSAGLVQFDRNIYAVSNIGIGNSSPSAPLDVVTNSTVWTGEFTQSNTSNGDGVIVTVGSTAAADYALSIRSDAGNTGAFNVKADGNVGIGTFSPTFTATSFKGLEVEVSGDLFPNVRLERVSGSSKTNQAYEMVIGTAGNWHVRNATQGTAPFSIATTDAITMSRLVGISATPEAHYTGYAALDFGLTGTMYSATSGTNITSLINNAYLNSNASAWVYKQADEASYLAMMDGKFRFFTAAAGSAGGSITWGDEKMVIEQGGSVGIGTTNPGRLLTLFNNDQPVFQITNNTSGSASTRGLIMYQMSGTYVTAIDNQGAGSGGEIRFLAAGTEKLRIDPSASAGHLQMGAFGVTGLNTTAAIHGAGNDATLVLSNGNLANTNANYGWQGRAGRVLTSNGSNWASDGRDPALVIGSASQNDDRGRGIGILLHNETNTDNHFSPLIGWGNKSNSGSYNTMYAYIVGKKTGQGTDANWSKGELQFDTAGTKNGQGGAYFEDVPAMTIKDTGTVVKPYQPYFEVYRSGTQGGYNAANNYAHVVIYNSVQSNIGGHYNTSTGFFTAPITGVYYFIAAAYVAWTSGQAWFSSSGGGRLQGTDMVMDGMGQFPAAFVIMRLTANDTIGFHPYASSITNGNIYANANHTYFRGYFLG